MSHFSTRPVENTEEDMRFLVRFMDELAAFDGHKAHLDVQKLREQLFHVGTNVRAFLAFRKEEAIGFILFYECFTVYYGERGLYVPGAYIVPQYRHLGYGVRLFERVAAYALENGFMFMNWIVEAHNEKARKLYEKMGAQISEGWNYVRIPLENIKKIKLKSKGSWGE